MFRKAELGVPSLEVCKNYYRVCSLVDNPNRCRQDDLKLEKKIEVKEW